jgi:hypothetical protein
MIPGLGMVIGKVTGVIADHISNKDDLKKAQQEATDSIVDAFNEANLKQIEVNMKQAEHPDLFVSGARPFLMWVCGAGFAYSFVIQPLLGDIFAATMDDPPALTKLDVEELKVVLFGLLGLGAIRTVEKVQGVARSAMDPMVEKKGFFKRLRGK